MKVQKILKDDDWNFLDTRNEFAYKNILHIMNEIDKDIVLEILDKKPDLVLKLDKYKSGWGSGSEKKALISPIINALAEKAEEKGINSKTIQDFKTKCNKELNAMFYTDEKVLQGEVEKMVKLLNSK